MTTDERNDKNEAIRDLLFTAALTAAAVGEDVLAGDYLRAMIPFDEDEEGISEESVFAGERMAEFAITRDHLVEVPNEKLHEFYFRDHTVIA